MIAAEVLGVDPASIDVILADTSSDAYDGGVGGSGSTFGSGMAVERASEAARAELIRRAEESLEARADDIEIHGGSVSVRGAPGRSIPFGTLTKTSAGGPIVGRGESEGGDDPEFDSSLVESHDFASWMAPSFTTTAAEVDVDPETGRVVVRRLVTAQDVGFAVNPTGVIGQIEGGAVQGLGWALTEGLQYDGGTLINSGFRGYLLPTAVDAPRIDSIIVESPSVEGPRGMKGAGEPPVTTPPGAIANAIRDAVGVAPHETPMTPERVWRAIHDV
jgi:CO/xanthine dehydrogenase Mo-binding subunit